MAHAERLQRVAAKSMMALKVRLELRTYLSSAKAQTRSALLHGYAFCYDWIFHSVTSVLSLQRLRVPKEYEIRIKYVQCALDGE
mmetsp:Transcript_44265/g.65674  ORF Transcript_44265/g.65674 Transcript_44265/m.65674 type:complete len:84 (-) Transcript_44265:857-1108(-)